MINKVKSWLGIEGVKVSVEVPAEVSRRAGQVQGVIRLQSMHAQEVTQLRIKAYEQYARGRWRSIKTETFLIGSMEYNEKIAVPTDAIIELPFTLPIHLPSSKIDKIADYTWVTDKIMQVAKKVEGVSSTFKVEVEAVVNGTYLPPFGVCFFEMKY